MTSIPEPAAEATWNNIPKYISKLRIHAIGDCGYSKHEPLRGGSGVLDMYRLKSRKLTSLVGTISRRPHRWRLVGERGHQRRLFHGELVSDLRIFLRHKFVLNTENLARSWHEYLLAIHVQAPIQDFNDYGDLNSGRRLRPRHTKHRDGLGFDAASSVRGPSFSSSLYRALDIKKNTIPRYMQLFQQRLLIRGETVHKTNHPGAASI